MIRKMEWRVTAGNTGTGTNTPHSKNKKTFVYRLQFQSFMILANMETCDLPNAIIPRSGIQIVNIFWKKAVRVGDR